jgi:hypothetical protein
MRTAKKGNAVTDSSGVMEHGLAETAGSLRIAISMHSSPFYLLTSSPFFFVRTSQHL